MIWWVVGGVVGAGMILDMLDGAAEEARLEAERERKRRDALARHEQARLEAMWAKQQRAQLVARIFNQELATQSLVLAQEIRQRALSSDLEQLRENLRVIEARLPELQHRAQLPGASHEVQATLATAQRGRAQQLDAIDHAHDELRACARDLERTRRRLGALERERRTLTGSNPRRLS